MFRYLIVILSVLLASPSWVAAASHPASKGLSDVMVRLPGHVLSALAQAKRIDMGTSVDKSKEPMTLTLVLKRDDQAGFDRYLQEVYNPKSKNYKNFLSQSMLNFRFGPSLQSYELVRSWLTSKGFKLIQDSSNRLTLTVKGTRQQTGRAFKLHIKDYKIGHKRTFYANDKDPALPKEFAFRVAAVSGLTNYAVAKAPVSDTTPAKVKARCLNDALGLIPFYGLSQAYFHQGQAALGGGTISLNDYINDGISVTSSLSVLINKLFPFSLQLAIGDCAGYYLGYALTHNGNFSLASNTNLYQQYLSLALNSVIQSANAATIVNHQKIGLLEFDTFQRNDVQDWLNLVPADPTIINQLSEVHVNGGAGSPGLGESEVLLDIAAVMITDPSPNASYVVYDAPIGTSFQQLFNAMINDGVTVISNSWSQCEDQTSLADAQSIDSILAQAAASGISVLNGSGDNGSTCLDGKPNTIGVPADSPHATAVGGTTPNIGPGYTYGNETWWDGSSAVPATGQGGFGNSLYFARPIYQNGLTTAPMRSIPDLVNVADPRSGLQICQADKGGCPTDLVYGGTSMATPLTAGMVAFLNEILGSNIGELNPVLYALADTNAFHSASSLGSDFNHVGLGSPHMNNIRAAISHQSVGLVSATASLVLTSNTIADGESTGIVQVNLADDIGYAVSGKTVTLTPIGTSHAVIKSVSGASDENDGAVVFEVVNSTSEKVTFSVIDVSDGVTLTHTATVNFDTPPATNAGINAFPTTVSADGISAATLTVTLKDSLSRPTPGKLINLSQGSGHSIITGPTPSITDANGQIIFTATNQVNEIVTYSAVDATDGGLPIPGNPQVTFSGGSGSACGQSTPLPLGQNGYTVTPFVTGIVSGSLSYGGINFGGCAGISTPGFLNGSVYVSNLLNGDLFRLGASGGVATPADRLSTQGPTLSSPVFGKDGKLYAARIATTGDFNTGAILEIDPTTGAFIRNVVANVRCPFSLAIDPLSGDLFYDDGCSGNGSDDPTIHRVINPGSATPTLAVYATLPSTPNGKISFAPNGTMYVDTGYFSATPTISVVSGTNTANPGTVSTLAGINSFFWVNVAESDATGAAKSLLITTAAGLELVDIATQTHTLLAQNLGGGEIGPDGCLYSPIGSGLFKLTDSTGGCSFTSSGASPSLRLALATGSPSPVQGNPETFNATLQQVSAPAGTAVFFTVTGANPQIKLVHADTNGKAALTYTAVFAGKDTITATTIINGATLSSNPVQVTWAAGEHVTFLSLNPSPTGGTVNQPLSVSASLTDVSANPAAPVANQVVNFTLDGGTCTATTDVKGITSCSLTPFILGGGTLTASFAGTNQLVPATASIGFNTMPVAVEPLPTVTIAVNPTTVAPGASVALTWSSTGATSCTASGAWSGSQATSGNLSVTQAQPGTYTYTLTCNGQGGSASKSATLTVNQLPTVTIAVSPTTVATGVNAAITWSSTNAMACTASGAWSGLQSTSGNQNVSQAQPGTYTYTLACNGPGGSASNSATLTVAPLPTVTIAVNPATVAPGDNSTLTWSSTNSTACTASGAWSGVQSTSGNLGVTQAQPGTYTYTLSCNGPGGSASKSATLTVAAVAQLPTVSISVNPATVAPSAPAALIWSSTNATSCTASGAWSGSKSVSGNHNVSQAQPGTYTYTLTCNGAGGSTSKSAALTVQSSTGSTPFATLSAKLEIDKKEFELSAEFTLGSNSDGINPATEKVTLRIGDYVATLPVGNCKKGKDGKFTYSGKVNGASLDIVITPVRGAYQVSVEGLPSTVIGTAKQVAVELTIGNDSGKTTVTAKRDM
jgi:hypothetical protein